MRYRYLLAALCLMPGLLSCYSLACVGFDKRLTAPGRSEAVRVIVWEQEPGLADFDSTIEGTLLAVLTYPLDVVASSAFTVVAAFDSRLAVRWGPVGALGAITLPGVTLVPSRFGKYPVREVTIEPQALDALLVAIQDGRPQPALKQIKRLWRPRVVAVEVVGVVEEPLP